NPDYILLRVDSTIGGNKANIYIKVKDLTPIEALKPYRINEINIYPNYSLRSDSALRVSQPIIHNDFNLYDTRNTYKPRPFDRLVFFRKDERFNRRDHGLSLKRLVNIDTCRDAKPHVHHIH